VEQPLTLCLESKRPNTSKRDFSGLSSHWLLPCILMSRHGTTKDCCPICPRCAPQFRSLQTVLLSSAFTPTATSDEHAPTLSTWILRFGMTTVQHAWVLDKCFKGPSATLVERKCVHDRGNGARVRMWPDHRSGARRTGCSRQCQSSKLTFWWDWDSPFAGICGQCCRQKAKVRARETIGCM